MRALVKGQRLFHLNGTETETKAVELQQGSMKKEAEAQDGCGKRVGRGRSSPRPNWVVRNRRRWLEGTRNRRFQPSSACRWCKFKGQLSKCSSNADAPLMFLFTSTSQIQRQQWRGVGTSLIHPLSMAGVTASLLNGTIALEYRKQRGFVCFCFSRCSGYRHDIFLTFICIIHIFSITFLTLDEGSANYTPRAPLNLVCITLLNVPFISKHHSASMCTKYMNKLLLIGKCTAFLFSLNCSFLTTSSSSQCNVIALKQFWLP